MPPARRQTLEPTPRYLGLDIGNRRIGVAVSDELGLTAQPVLTLERRRPAPSISREDLRSIARLCRRFGVVGIVVGNPVHLSGDPSRQDHRRVVDQVAATLILQSFIDAQRSEIRGKGLTPDPIS